MRRTSVKTNAYGFRTIIVLTLAGLGVLASAPVRADEAGQYRSIAAMQAAAAMDGIEVSKNYALGINRFNLDGQTEILGWRLNGDWYFGRQDGLDSGLTLVWQQETNQVSLSKDGLRLTRRF